MVRNYSTVRNYWLFFKDTYDSTKIDYSLILIFLSPINHSWPFHLLTAYFSPFPDLTQRQLLRGQGSCRDQLQQLPNQFSIQPNTCCGTQWTPSKKNPFLIRQLCHRPEYPQQSNNYPMMEGW